MKVIVKTYEHTRSLTIRVEVRLDQTLIEDDCDSYLIPIGVLIEHGKKDFSEVCVIVVHHIRP